MNQSIGEKFPDLQLTDHAGENVRLSDLTAGKFPLFVIFYRGYW